MKTWRVLIFTVLALIWTISSQASDVSSVSMVQLLAAPDRFDGKKVRVIGYLKLEFEGNALYLHRDDYENGITENAIWVDTETSANPALHLSRPPARKQLSDRYVLLEGTFDAGHKGHMGLFSGALTNVDRAEAWPSRAELEAASKHTKMGK